MAKKDDSYWAVRDLVEDQTQEGFFKTNKSMAKDLGMLAEEYPQGMAELQSKNTDRQEQFLNRMQFDNEDILARSPETIRELDEYLINEAPYSVNVALGSESKYDIADTKAMGYIAPKIPFGTEQRGRMAGSWEDDDPSYTAIHETGHAKGLMGDSAADTIRDRWTYILDPDEAYEAATTGLDLYRGLSSGHEKSTKHALEYLMKQGVDIRDEESLEDLKANIVNGVERLYDKSEGVLEFSDEKRTALQEDLDVKFQEIPDLITKYEEEARGYSEGGLMKKDKELVDEEYLESSVTPEMKAKFEEKVTSDMNFLEKVIYDLTGVVGPDKIKQYIESSSDEEAPELNAGGMMMPMGMDIVVGFDEVSGNPIPPGSNAENVRDDIPAMLSDGEYVLPADVVKWHGLSQIMEWQDEAKIGLMAMHCEGLIPEIEEEDLEEVEETEEETSDEDKSEDTPEVEEAVVEVEDELTGEETTEEPEEKKLPGKVKRSKYV